MVIVPELGREGKMLLRRSMVVTVEPVGEMGKGVRKELSMGVLWSGVGFKGRRPLAMSSRDSMCGGARRVLSRSALVSGTGLTLTSPFSSIES